MPTTRKRVGHRMAFMITPQAIDAWRRGDVHACRQSLGVMPWDYCPFHVEYAEPPDWLLEPRHANRAANADSWRHAWELRCALIELAGEPGPFDRHGQPLRTPPAPARHHP
jgi:hypothetical protein